jgi:hypothetical protein
MGGKSLGYKIKYIDPSPGRKHKRAMFEIEPGMWVSRAHVPGHKARHWPHNNKWNNSEYGYIMNLYSSAFKESKSERIYKSGRRGKKVPFNFTKDTWWQHWLKQKAEYGMRCPYTKVLMTTIRGKGRGTHGGKKVPTNISKDQIWPGRGYTPINLIFCSVKFNMAKKSITPDGCEAVTDIYNERMNEWAANLPVRRKRNGEFHE